MTRRVPPWVAAAAAVVYLFLHAPLVALMVFSFNDSTIQALPWKAFTLKWYQALPDNAALLDAMWLSFRLALMVTAIAATVGTAFAFVLASWQSRFSTVT